MRANLEHPGRMACRDDDDLLMEGRQNLETCGGQRPRVAAVRRDSRVCVIVSGQAGSNASLAVTIKGRCQIHHDAPTKQWFFDQLTKMAFPDNEGARQSMLKLLASPDRVVLSITAEKRFSYDGAKMAQALMNAMQAA